MDEDRPVNAYDRVRWFLGVVLLAGIFVLAVSAQLPHDWYRDLIRDLGIAAVVAAVLGFLVDRTLKHDLAREAVATTLGYMLPPAIRGELAWIYNQEFLCDEHIFHYSLIANPDQTVTIRSHSTRRIRSITSSQREITVGLGIDEWGLAGHPSKIESVQYRVGQGDWTDVPIRENLAPWELGIDTVKTQVPRGETVEVHARYEETKRDNDEHNMTFRYMTRNPRVLIDVDAGLNYKLSFSHREQGQLGEDQSGSYRLDGTLLPEQRIGLRWWPRDLGAGGASASERTTG